MLNHAARPIRMLSFFIACCSGCAVESVQSAAQQQQILEETASLPFVVYLDLTRAASEVPSLIDLKAGEMMTLLLWGDSHPEWRHSWLAGQFHLETEKYVSFVRAGQVGPNSRIIGRYVVRRVEEGTAQLVKVDHNREVRFEALAPSEVHDQLPQAVTITLDMRAQKPTLRREGDGEEHVVQVQLDERELDLLLLLLQFPGGVTREHLYPMTDDPASLSRSYLHVLAYRLRARFAALGFARTPEDSPVRTSTTYVYTLLTNNPPGAASLRSLLLRGYAVLADDGVVHLTAQEYQVVTEIIEASDAYVTSPPGESPNALQVHVSRIREKIERVAAEARQRGGEMLLQCKPCAGGKLEVIRTRRGKGYFLDPCVRKHLLADLPAGSDEGARLSSPLQ